MVTRRRQLLQQFARLCVVGGLVAFRETAENLGEQLAPLPLAISLFP